MFYLTDKESEAMESLLDLISKEKMEIEIYKTEFPVRARIKREVADRNQISMIETQKKIYDGYIEFVFMDELIMNIENFKIEDDLLNKIKNKLKKWHYAYLELFFERFTRIEEYAES